MRKFLLIVGVLGIIAGTGVWLVGMTKMEWNFEELDMTKYESHTFVSDDITELTSIKIDSTNWNYKIIESEDSKVYVDYFSSKYSTLEVAVNDGKLVATEKTEKYFAIGMFQLFKAMNKEVIIKIPKGLVPNLDFDSVNSNLDVDIDLGTIEIDNTNGDFVADGQSFGDITADLINGKIKLNNVKAGSMKTNMVNGNVGLTGTILDRLQGDMTNGNVVLDKATCPIIVLEMVNGSLRGSIVGDVLDYQVYFSSLNGKSNISNNSDSSRTKSIKLNTLNGKLDITFVSA